MSTPVAMKLITVAVAGALLAFLLGVVAMVNIWREGYSGAARAFTGIVLSLPMLAAPAAVIPKMVTLAAHP